MKITRTAIGVAFLSASIALATTPANAASVSPIYTLQWPADGGSVVGSLVIGPDGLLYGATRVGGSAGNGGTIFRISSGGAFTTLVAFDGTNGANPAGALVVGPDGNLYGATQNGGANDAGTIFQVTPSCTLTTLASIEAGCTALGALVAASDGNFYGSMSCDSVGWIFRVTAAGLLTRLVSIGAFYPADFGLAQGDDGILYGATIFGGTNGAGTIFRTTLSGTLTTLASMDTSIGIHPSGRLARGADGNLGAWWRFTGMNVIHSPGHQIGCNYLALCSTAQGESSSEARRVAEGIRSVLTGRAERFLMDYSCRTRSEQRWFALTVTPLADDHRNGAVVTHLNVTADRKNQEDLRASEVLLRQIAENSSDVWFLVEAVSNDILYVSRAYEEIWGRSCESLYEKPTSWIDALHTDDRATAYEKYQQGELEYECRIARPDGSSCWVQMRGFPVCNEGGTVVRFAGVVQDVTARKHREDELRRERDQALEALRTRPRATSTVS